MIQKDRKTAICYFNAYPFKMHTCSQMLAELDYIAQWVALMRRLECR